MAKTRLRANPKAKRTISPSKATSGGPSTGPEAPPVESPAGGLLALQRIAGNRAATALLQSRRAAGPPFAGGRVPGVAIQRRANLIPTSDNLKKDAPVELLGSNPFEKALQEIDAYYAKPADDFGMQLFGLEAIVAAVAAWEAENGPLSQKVDEGFFGMSRTDKRRLALVKVRNAIPNEETQVKTQGHTRATAEHQEDRAKLMEYLNLALASPEKLLHNSAEWILNAKKAKLYALTPTGDSYARLTKGKKNPRKDEAWFPSGKPGAAGDVASAAVSYNKDDLADNTNVVLDDDGKVTGGWNSPGLIAITRPANKSKETVWETIRHEVQHDADMNKGRDVGTGIRAAAEKVAGAGNPTDKKKAEAVLATERSLQRYKTEYRAYSYEGSTQYAALDNTVQNKTVQGLPFSERQLQIFKHIYSGYAYTKEGWDKNSPLADGKTFREAVSAYWNPDTEGFNKLNSARVDDFYRALDAIGGKKAKTASETSLGLNVAPVDTRESDPDAPSVKALMTAIDALEGPEADYVFNEARQFDVKIAQHLEGKAKAKVVEELSDKAASSKLASLFE